MRERARSPPQARIALLAVVLLGRVALTSEQKAMHTWLRSVIDRILGRVSGKNNRLDTATRMAMDADFSGYDNPRDRALTGLNARDDEHLIKPIEPSADRVLFEQLIRIVNEAQELDAKDERWLYSPIPAVVPLRFKREHLDPGSRF